jgi:hypothetical protein
MSLSTPTPPLLFNKSHALESLLQPLSYASSHPNSYTLRQLPIPHSQDTIRTNTMQLSNMVITPITGTPVHTPESFIYPIANYRPKSPHDRLEPPIPSSLSQSISAENIIDLSAISSRSTSISPNDDGVVTPRGQDKAPLYPSGLSLLLASRGREGAPESADTDKPSTSPTEIESSLASVKSTAAEHPGDLPPKDAPATETAGLGPSEAIHTVNAISMLPPFTGRRIDSDLTETAPLLGGSHRSYHSSPLAPSKSSKDSGVLRDAGHFIYESLKPDHLGHVLAVGVKSLPAVLLGSLLNILDGVSCKDLHVHYIQGLYQLICNRRNDHISSHWCICRSGKDGGVHVLRLVGLFPGYTEYSNFITYFTLFGSTVVAQLVYTLGGSGFAGANGSMMIEVVVRVLFLLRFLACLMLFRTIYLALLPYPRNQYRK